MARRHQNRGGVFQAITRFFGAPKKREAAYDGGGSGRRTRNWIPGASGPNALLLGSLQTQRNRARDLARKVPWVASAIETVTADIVGQGIRPLSLSTSEQFKEQIEPLWRDWVDEADADEVGSFYGLQSMAVRTMIEAGECFARRRRRRLSDGLSVPLQIQILEPEFVPLDSALGMAPRPGNTIKQGIEFNKVGKRVAYWMYKSHPHDHIGIGAYNPLQMVRVPAKEVLHVYKPLRPGQIRGVPWLSTVILRVRDLLEFEDAILVKQKTSAMFVAFVTKLEGQKDPLPDDDYEEDGDDDEVGETTLEAGTVQILEPGEDVTFSTPPGVGESYEMFLKTQLRSIGAQLGASFEGFTGDYSDSNFSTARMSRNNLQRRTIPIQDGVNFQLNNPVLRWFVEAGVISGALSAPGYVDKPRDYTRTDWIAPAWPYVNPKEEAEADKIQVQSGFESRKNVVRKRGREVGDIDADQAEDNERADSLGLIHSSDGRHAIKETDGAEVGKEESSEDEKKS